MQLKNLFSLLVLATSFSAFAGGNELKIDFYQTRYPLSDVYTKQVDNHGDGDERLYGTRNFRAVLNGVLYRGGANNKFNKYDPRDNRNPLPAIGLQNLCEEGFSQAFYMYSTNFKTAAPETICNSMGQGHKLKYSQASPYNMTGLRAMFSAIKKTIDTDGGPIYIHCWNGWHASGLFSALALRQFCGTSAAAAVSYWDKNTDGNNTEPDFESIRQSIRDFIPLADYKITPEMRERICPNL